MITITCGKAPPYKNFAQHPIIAKTFSFNKIRIAHDLVAGGTHIGIVVLNI
jgi:hypothetical protein